MSLPRCAHPTCRNRVKKQGRKYCCHRCVVVHLSDTRRRILSEAMTAWRARQSPAERHEQAVRARAKGVYTQRARMFREDVASMPQRCTREDLYALCAKVYARGRWAAYRSLVKARKAREAA